MSSDSNKKPIVIIPQTSTLNIRRLEIEQLNQSDDLEASSEKISEELSDDPFLNFVASYSLFTNNSEDTQLDLTQVLTQLNEKISIIKPPANHLLDFHQQLQIKENQINELADTLKQLPDSKLFSCIQDVEKLYYRLSVDFQEEYRTAQKLRIV
ncbi:unnamed protein product [Paramecium sonneborni]|uniref:Uncharacterized protein n=1 Tax=Paramecium sonneborni TaxID=65129 RepID=A0A8S1RHP2_9CILI|nr:unnamed protein product [Paramecium sonneborni]